MAAGMHTNTRAAALRRRARRSVVLEHWHVAREQFEALLALRPADPRALAGAGRAAEHGGDFEAAAEYLADASGRLPDDVGLLRLLGYVQQRLQRLDAAADSFERALALDPDHAATHVNLGAVQFARGDLQNARQCFQAVLARNPGNVSACFNLGNTEKALGNTEAARARYERALALSPGHAGAHYNLARLDADAGRAQEAVAGFEAAIAARPDYAEAAHELGHALSMLARDGDAAVAYERAVSLAPHRPGPSISLARCLRRLRRVDEARAACQRLLEGGYDDAEMLFQIASLAHDLGEYDQALDIVDRVLAAAPDDDAYLNLKAVVLHARGEFEAASEWACRAVALKPRNAHAHGTLAAASLANDDIVAARRHAERALEIDPGMTEARATLALALVRQGELQDAAVHAARALRTDPDCDPALIARGLVDIAHGNLLEGWRGYERRLSQSYHRSLEGALGLSLSRWPEDGVDEGREIVLYGEEGVGDQVMQASCLPDMLARGTRCLVICEPRLVPLLERSFDVTAYGYDAALNKIPARAHIQNCDFVFSMASLFHRFRNRLDDFPDHDGYLRPDPERIAFWRRRYRDLGDALKVGISWRGGARRSARALRSTDLGDWRPVLNVPGVEFVNLQYGECGDDLAAARRESGAVIHDWEEPDPLKDLDEFAAQVAALDLVISIDNSTVHFAGALGVPCWVMLPYAASWIWLRGRDTSPWYPSLRLFRQGRSEAWIDVIERVAAELRGHRASPFPRRGWPVSQAAD